MKKVYIIYLRKISTNEIKFTRCATCINAARDYAEYVNNCPEYAEMKLYAHFDEKEMMCEDELITVEDARILLKSIK